MSEMKMVVMIEKMEEEKVMLGKWQVTVLQSVAAA